MATKATHIVFDRGSLLVRGEGRVPYAAWDGRVGAFRAPALYYREIMEYLDQSNLSFQDNVLDLIPCRELQGKLQLRGYQRAALKAWERAGRRGVVVLPTGAGKTMIALKAIESVNQPAIVVVPTLDLLEQWRRGINEEFEIEVGVCGGGENSLKEVTVSTYDSAYLRAGELGNRFSLLVFDEIHHLPAVGYRQIAEMFAAPYRLGLTATFEREDGLHEEIPRLTGGVVYRLRPEALTGRFLSDYTLQRMNVELTEAEKREYDRNYKEFRGFLASRRISISTPMEFRRFIMRSGRDPEARRALLARNRALDIAFNSESKILALEGILRENLDERLLIFTQHNRLVFRISHRFLLPYITQSTGKEERREILEGFKDGKLRAIVSSKVLDEGIDVPEASLGVVVSGTGSSREFTQRLGRLLRKKEGKTQARLIELVSKSTTETRTSYRRTRAV